MANVDRVIYACPVKRLGSLVDLSPLVKGLARAFPGRLTLVDQSQQADNLWRHWLSQAKAEGVLTDLRDPAQAGNLGDLQDGRVIALPLADDYSTAVASYSQVDACVPQNGYRIGTGYFQDFFRSMTEADRIKFGSLGSVKRTFPYFDCSIAQERQRQPRFLNGHMSMLSAAISQDNPYQAVVFTPEDRAQLVWTNQAEVEVAKQAFLSYGFDPSRTIGFHLTAGHYDAFKQIWSRESFLQIARHFIETGYNILLITGTLSGKKAEEQRGIDWTTHVEFLNTLRELYKTSRRKNAMAIFYGDALEDAEVIRRCRVFFSAQTGPANLATAVGTPKVTIAANCHQAGQFTSTGRHDFEFISPNVEPGSRGQLVAATKSNVIEALDQVLQS